MPQLQDAPGDPVSSRPQPPGNPFEAWEPRDDAPWNTRRAGHLLRRVGFGATPERLKATRDAGPRAAVDALFDFDPAADVGGFNAFLEQAAGLYDIRRNVSMVAEWWFHRMTHTPAPLQERLALFWHNHFATSATKVGRSQWMHDQIELFRTDGLGSFRSLLVKVGRQPAMLRWLDGDGSRKGSPNENYAREILELFALGVGHYTEDDVQELARAFTGWQIRGNNSGFNRDRWDDGEKTVFGQTGSFDDEQAVSVILAHEQAPRHVARKLLQCFVHPDPESQHVEHYAQRLREHDWHVGPVLREMFASRLFFSRWAYRSRIKEPVEMVVGLCNALRARPRAQFARQITAQMGQAVLYPPDVAGWRGGETWINANTVMVRFRFGLEGAQQGFNEFVDRDMMGWLRDNGHTSAVAIVNAYADLLLDGEIPPEARGRLLDYMTRDDQNRPAEFEFNNRAVEHKVRGMVQLMCSMPHFQLA